MTRVRLLLTSLLVMAAATAALAQSSMDQLTFTLTGSDFRTLTVTHQLIGFTKSGANNQLVSCRASVADLASGYPQYHETSGHGYLAIYTNGNRLTCTDNSGSDNYNNYDIDLGPLPSASSTGQQVLTFLRRSGNAPVANATPSGDASTCVRVWGEPFLNSLDVIRIENSCDVPVAVTSVSLTSCSYVSNCGQLWFLSGGTRLAPREDRDVGFAAPDDITTNTSYDDAIQRMQYVPVATAVYP